MEAMAEERTYPVPAEERAQPGGFQSLVLIRIQDTRPKHLDGGRTVLRPSLPYDETTRLASCFLDLYIGARYALLPRSAAASAGPRFWPAPSP